MWYIDGVKWTAFQRGRTSQKIFWIVQPHLNFFSTKIVIYWDDECQSSEWKHVFKTTNLIITINGGATILRETINGVRGEIAQNLVLKRNRVFETGLLTAVCKVGDDVPRSRILNRLSMNGKIRWKWWLIRGSRVFRLLVLQKMPWSDCKKMKRWIRIFWNVVKHF